MKPSPAVRVRGLRSIIISPLSGLIHAIVSPSRCTSPASLQVVKMSGHLPRRSMHFKQRVFGKRCLTSAITRSSCKRFVGALRLPRHRRKRRDFRKHADQIAHVVDVDQRRAGQRCQQQRDCEHDAGRAMKVVGDPRRRRARIDPHDASQRCARARRSQHETGYRGCQQQQSGDADDVRSGVAKQHVAVKLVQRAQQIGRRKLSDSIERAPRCAPLTGSNIASIRSAPTRRGLTRSVSRYTSPSATGNRIFSTSPSGYAIRRARRSSAHSDACRASARFQQARVKPCVDRIFEHKDGATQSHQRKPHAETDAKPAVNGEPCRTRSHAPLLTSRSKRTSLWQQPVELLLDDRVALAHPRFQLRTVQHGDVAAAVMDQARPPAACRRPRSRLRGARPACWRSVPASSSARSRAAGPGSTAASGTVAARPHGAGCTPRSAPSA